MVIGRFFLLLLNRSRIYYLWLFAAFCDNGDFGCLFSDYIECFCRISNVGRCCCCALDHLFWWWVKVTINVLWKQQAFSLCPYLNSGLAMDIASCNENIFWQKSRSFIKSAKHIKMRTIAFFFNHMPPNGSFQFPFLVWNWRKDSPWLVE